MLHLLAANMSDPTVDDIVKIIAVSAAMLIGLAATIFGIVAGMVKHSATERTRREIAAYISEGSMTADEGERLLKAGGVTKWHGGKA